MPKNCLVYVALPCLTGLDALILFHVVIESGNVNECLMLEHTSADPFGELFDLFLNVRSCFYFRPDFITVLEIPMEFINKI